MGATSPHLSVSLPVNRVIWGEVARVATSVRNPKSQENSIEESIWVVIAIATNGERITTVTHTHCFT